VPPVAAQVPLLAQVPLPAPVPVPVPLMVQAQPSAPQRVPVRAPV